MLCADQVAVSAGLLCAVVYGTVGMSRLVSNDLPLGFSFDDNVGTSDLLASVSAVVLRACCAGLSKPSQSNGGSGVTGR